jgi:lipopolysaccharide transport system ATP-binding protein
MSLLVVQNLGKSYRTYHSEWQRFARWFGVSVTPRSEQWVLRNIDFTIESGESIGVLGKNGAGKSTLLKMIAGTVQPSEGTVQLNGRIAAILELGMGFNPELTGRQNVMHAAGLMGYSKVDIETAMPDIQAFSDIEEYFDLPVRTYSSGMQSRVSFAVATAFKTDILIVDESLAVGDAAFQRKCFRRLEGLIAQGTTLLFVSHDIDSVKKICKKALFIDHGRLVEFGDAKKVCDHYEKALFGKSDKQKDQKHVVLLDATLKSDCEVSYGDGRGTIANIVLAGAEGDQANVFRSNEDMSIEYDVQFHEAVRSPVFTCMIKTKEGIAVSGTDSTFLEAEVVDASPGDVLKVKFSFSAALVPGFYYVNCGVRDADASEAGFIHRRVDAAIFKVVSGDDTTALVGVADLQARLEVSTP